MLGPSTRPKRRLQVWWPHQKRPSRPKETPKAGMSRSASSSSSRWVGTRSMEMTSRVTAKANAASVNVSTRVISRPRRRMPPERSAAVCEPLLEVTAGG